ncbi:hypothetical protein BDW22DRAFT_1000002 [Trametopsis cervina]|nr:hypothetical protein BDW22DRAFT_1000002 [Trametopsis cervina]
MDDSGQYIPVGQTDNVICTPVEQHPQPESSATSGTEPSYMSVDQELSPRIDHDTSPDNLQNLSPPAILSNRQSRIIPARRMRAYNPEQGWDDETNEMGTVLEYPTNNEVTKRIAFTARMVHPKLDASGQFSFVKIFGDGNFMAAGQLIIPPGGSKPTKGSKDNTFMFYVIEGAVAYKVHRTRFVLSTGGMFLVPRGNTYYIQNISDRDAKLFFAQARELNVVDTERSSSASHIPVLPPLGQ